VRPSRSQARSSACVGLDGHGHSGAGGVRLLDRVGGREAGSFFKQKSWSSSRERGRGRRQGRVGNAGGAAPQPVLVKELQ
jgi:hypothetical protein